VRNTFDAVIVGAGVQGVSAAYHLATQGMTDLVVLDSGERPGTGSSSRSAAMLMLQRETTAKIRLSQFSFERYMSFEDDLGVNAGYKRTGFLSVATSAKREHALEMAQLRTDLGVATRLLEPTQIESLVPGVNVDDIVVGVLGPDDGLIDPPRIVDGYASAAEQLGVTFRFGSDVTGITVENGSVQGVRTLQEYFASPVVVNAAGAHAERVASYAGVHLPIENSRRSIYLTADLPDGVTVGPMVEDAEAEWYYRGEGEGVLMGMGKEAALETGNEPNWEFLPQVMSFAKHRVPALATARVVGGWSGIRSLTPDVTPIIGPVDGISGFFNSCGWGGEGIMHAPAGGTIVAEWVLGTSSRTLDPLPFLLSRFGQAPR
jgi:sarcosine oxidase subunit beta